MATVCYPTTGSPVLRYGSISRRGRGRHPVSHRSQTKDSEMTDCQKNHGVEMTYHVGTSIPFRALSQSCALLATVFGHYDETDTPERVQFSNYTIRLIAALQSRAMVETSDFVLFMAHQVSTGALAGVVTISKGLDAAGARGYSLECSECTAYSLCNMAVKSSFRRRGIATHMLQCVEEYLHERGKDVVLVLSVEKYNIEAQGLYETLGYTVDESWVDPRWLESVERDRIDVPRRILMHKHVT